MRHSIYFMLLLLAGCKTTTNNLILVWPTEKQPLLSSKVVGKAITETEAPQGFILSPLDVSEMCSPRKYLISIYADHTNYYVAKFKASADEAKRFGECINGRTGKITRPKERNKHSILFIKEYQDNSQRGFNSTH